jgi:hypothetical protein
MPTFYASIDHSHCVQACLKMLFSVTLPGEKFSWKQLEELTDFIPGHGAWVYAELLALHGYGLDARLITGFDIERFIKEGFGYIESEYGKAVADYEREHPHNYPRIKQQMKQALEQQLINSRHGQLDDVHQLIDEQWYVMMMLNSKMLDAKPGYTGHRVLVYGYDKNGVTMHDPGTVDKNTEARKVNWELLDSSWQNGRELLAVKKHGS